MSWDKDDGLNDVTLAELNALCKTMFTLQSEVEALDAVVKDKKKILEGMKSKLIAYFDTHGMSSHKSDFGRVILSKRLTVKNPATPEDKKLFYDYLKDKGIFEDMVSVHSQTLAAFVKREVEAKQEEGVYGYTPPGIKEVGYMDIVSLRKA